ncbi:RING finger protein 37-like [Watersipora subatra]|uniref:RING finger protein 37-like n=1 Tax=Watersipora subatra TaxID=2589382 RepID=UPI00355B5C5A
MAVAVSPSFPINLLPVMKCIKISCDKPHYDGFSPSNLLIPNSKGFMAERFVKPPVNLTISFPCSIRLHAISFHNTVRSFTSSSFEIMSYGLAEGEEPLQSPSYKQIGWCRNYESATLCFINRKYSTGRDHLFNTAAQKYYISSYNSTFLNSVRCLAIRITHTLNGSMPVLKDLNVIGYPLSYDHLISHLDLMPTQPNHNRVSPVNGGQIDGLAEQPTLSGLSEQTPKEFIDPLTCDLMTLPVILPSGYTIDQLTLHKHIEAEKSWARKPSDPFTGMYLTDANSPVVNHLLKERIDRFILVNDIKTGRAVGVKRCAPMSDGGMPRVTPKQSCTGNSDLNSVDACDSQSDNHNKAKCLAQSESRISNRLCKVLEKSTNLRTVRLLPAASGDCSSCSSTNLKGRIFYQLAGCQHLLCKECLGLCAANAIISCRKCMAVTLGSQITRYHSA